MFAAFEDTLVGALARRFDCGNIEKEWLLKRCVVNWVLLNFGQPAELVPLNYYPNQHN